MYVLAFPEGSKPKDAVVDLYGRIGTGAGGATPRVLMRWRSTTDMYSWMEDLYYSKGGTGTAIDNWSVRLTAHDLDALERAIRRKCLTGIVGVTFCDFARTEAQDEADLAFVACARQALRGHLIVAIYAF